MGIICQSNSKRKGICCWDEGKRKNKGKGKTDINKFLTKEEIKILNDALEVNEPQRDFYKNTDDDNDPFKF